MKRLIFRSLLACLLVLACSFLVTTEAAARTATSPGAQPTFTATPISLARLKALVGQALGQQAVDHMGHRVTQPLSTQASRSLNLSFHQTRTANASLLRANASGYNTTSPVLACFGVNAEGVSWVQGIGGYFNVAHPALPAPFFATGIAVTNSDDSAQVDVGVDQTNLKAYLNFKGWFSQTLFSVSANDQMDAEIYLDGNTNKWLVFIEDLTTRTAFGEEYGYGTTNMVRADWFTGTNTANLVPAMNQINFTGARWVSNWDGWQPINSSAEAYYVLQSLVNENGEIEPWYYLGSSGTSFSMLIYPSY